MDTSYVQSRESLYELPLEFPKVSRVCYAQNLFGYGLLEDDFCAFRAASGFFHEFGKTFGCLEAKQLFFNLVLSNMDMVRCLMFHAHEQSFDSLSGGLQMEEDISQQPSGIATEKQK